MIIRPYNSGDEESVLSIWLRSTVEGQDFLPKAFWESKLDDVRTVYLPAAVTFVAEENGRIIGFISLLGTMIGGLFVDTNSQGRGVGTSLIESARVHAAQPLEVEVYEQNDRARKLYKKCGFVEHERYLQQETNEILLILKQVVSPAPVAEPQKKNWKDMVAEGLVEGAVSIALGILSGGD